MLRAQSQPPATGAEPQQLASPFAATVQRALAGSRARGSLKHPAKSGAGPEQAESPVLVGPLPDDL